MRKITRIGVHCALTYARMDIGAAEITAWHTDPNRKGGPLRTIGYHHVVRRRGKVEDGRPHREIGAHAQGHNRDSIGVCWVGGLGADGEVEDNRTAKQRAALLRLVVRLCRQYSLGADAVFGHGEVAPRGCPAIDMDEFRAEVAAALVGDRAAAKAAIKRKALASARTSKGPRLVRTITIEVFDDASTKSTEVAA